MKKIITGALVFVLFAGAARAQVADSSTHHRNGHQHKGGREMVYKNLNLTPDQQSRLKSLHEAERSEMEAVRKDNSLSKDQLKVKRQQIHQQYQSQAQAIFTPSQKEQLEKQRKEWKDKAKEGKQKGTARKSQEGRKSGNHDFAKELNLTAEQQQSLSKLRNDSRSQFETIRKDQSLSEDQKKAKLQELRKKQQEDMKSVLTQEQLAKWESMRKDRKSRDSK